MEYVVYYYFFIAIQLLTVIGVCNKYNTKIKNKYLKYYIIYLSITKLVYVINKVYKPKIA